MFISISSIQTCVKCGALEYTGAHKTRHNTKRGRPISLAPETAMP